MTLNYAATILVLLFSIKNGHSYDEKSTHLTSQDFHNAMLLTPADLYGRDEKRPLWAQDKYQGDIAGKSVSRRRLKVRGVARNGVRLVKDKWPNNQIPYTMCNCYSAKERAVIAKAIQAYHDRTCLRFVPRTHEPDYLYIGKIDGCFSGVGREGGRQDLSLDYGCLEYDTVIHELMHAVGFWHEHERWDRDHYITIIWENIAKDALDQFGKANLMDSNYYGEMYDYFSILHYDSKAFSRNGRPTMEAAQSSMTPIIGHMKDFSAVDLRKINKMYNCPPYYLHITGEAGNVWSNRLPTVMPPEQGGVSWRGLPPILPSPLQSNFLPEQADQCEDKASQCWLLMDRCRSLFYEFLMRYLCPKSCGFCT